MSEQCLIDTGLGWDWFTDPNCETPDWGCENGDLAANNQLLSAVIIQLFTNRRAPDDLDLPRGLPHPQGFWGDPLHGFEIGSLLWTLYREPITDTTVLRAERYAREAIAPIVSQGAAANSEILVERRGDRMSLTVRLLARDGQRVFDEQFQRFWQDDIIA